MSRISAVDLSCVRRDRLLFENLSFTINAGDLVYLTGQNGAGKTSLLRTVVGFHQPFAGDLFFDGSSIQQADVRRNYARSLVYIGHKSAIEPRATALENSQFWCAQQGIAATVNDIYQVLEVLGLVGLEDVPCGQLSAGQNRRVALARLWLKSAANVWILDEPFTALDVYGIQLIEQQIQQFIQQGGCVLLTSHQMLQSVVPSKQLDLAYQL
ncbi:cytochrome c biogenesis heme-transporting ATPase CcmA [Alteromonas flava]|uniref:cytochrome c biogenesis heme-transporting ATPase CcmA n=1 Tax=Alteromonas flava TaxID=2048003 RepID=UPI000C28E7D0|nr:cytochrome c biogenesis heme-transporting ATPase CcmA [Alteromonas flava]